MFSTKIIVICGILILSVFVGLFIFMSSKEPLLKYKQIPALQNLPVEFPKSSSFSEKPIIAKETASKSLPTRKESEKLNAAVSPTPKPDLEAISKKKSSLPTRALSDYEVFAILHPPYYLKYLSAIEDLMIEDGVLRQNEKQVFDSEDKVIAFLKDKVFDYIVTQGIATAVDRPRFEHGLEVVQELHRNEAKYLRAALLPSPVHQISAFWEFVSLKIVQLFLPYARGAQECYQGGGSAPKLGSNLGAICCDCSIKRVPIGCLNAVCRGRPAIWDPSTFICGCG